GLGGSVEEHVDGRSHGMIHVDDENLFVIAEEDGRARTCRENVLHFHLDHALTDHCRHLAALGRELPPWQCGFHRGFSPSCSRCSAATRIYFSAQDRRERCSPTGSRRTIVAGVPMASDPGGISRPLGTTAPAAIMLRAPIFAPSMTMAP